MEIRVANVPTRLRALSGVISVAVCRFSRCISCGRCGFGVECRRTLVVPLLNLSVIVVATLAGALLLSDIPHAKARWGVALATASIGLMMWFGQ